MTVNDALTLMSHVRSRVSDLEKLRSEISTRTIFMSSEQREEVQFDPTKVEEEISRLKLWLIQADMKIKASNAITELQLDGDPGLLLKPVKGLTGNNRPDN